jgi:tRNA A-37 threonylcarbamoyl transferase component Bud32
VTDGDATISDGGDAGGARAEAYCSACNQSFAPEVTTCPNDGTKLVRFAAQRDELIGRVLDNRFEVRQPLGKGGMGTVYRAIQVSVDREVAIKVVHPKLADDRQAAKRFLREARLASRLNQPNIVNVIDFGQTEDGVLFLVMELLRGRTLAHELDGMRRFSVRRTCTIGLQLCDALEAAHAQGIVHRDLKPGNIVILDDPPGRDLLKVLDFGLAKSLATDTTSQVTNTNAILGTPLYMAPEQVQGHASDQRADLYALGCILYELLAGAPPFTDAAVNLILAKHLSDPPPPLPPHVPGLLRGMIERVLAKRPEDRVQTAGEMRRALEAVIEGGAAAGQPDQFDTVPELAMEYAMTADVSRVPGVAASTPAPAPRRRGGLWVGVAVLAVGVGAMTYAVVASRRGGAAAAATVDAAPGVVPAVIAVDAAPPPPPPPPIDAAVVVVDAAPAPTVDARPRSRDRDRDRPKPRPDAAKPAAPKRVDAEPDINFYPSTK